MNIKILYAYLLRVVIPPFLISFLLFTFFVETLDIVINLIRYLDREIPISSIIQLQWLYLPTSMSYALPVAILFSVTFSIGNLYANHELIAIFVSGVSLIRFVMPLIFLGLLLSIGNYYFKENVVIDTFREKNELTRIYLNQKISQSNSQVAILQDGGKIVYYAEFYDDAQLILNKPIIVITDDKNKLEMRINAATAQWNGSEWIFIDVTIYTFNQETNLYNVEQLERYSDRRLTVDPKNFRRIVNNIDEMKYKDAIEYINQLKSSGHPYHKLLTDTYSRIPLSLSPLIVMIVACLSGSVFRKNTMLMSLLNALLTAVVYYSSELIGSILAARNLVAPLVGAWLGFFTIIILSMLIYKYLIK